MWRKRDKSNWKCTSKSSSRDRKDKEKSSIICYECKKPRHFKFKCLVLYKTKDKKNYFKTKDKMLMSTWEDLNDTSLMKNPKKKKKQTFA